MVLKRFLHCPEAREGAYLPHGKLEDWQEWNVLALAPSSVIFHFASAQIMHTAVVSGNWSLRVGTAKGLWWGGAVVLPVWPLQAAGVQTERQLTTSALPPSPTPGTRSPSLLLLLLICKSREMDLTFRRTPLGLKCLWSAFPSQRPSSPPPHPHLQNISAWT